MVSPRLYRLTELSGRVLQVEGRLREERQRSASMERCLERRGLEAGGCSFVMSNTHTTPSCTSSNHNLPEQLHIEQRNYRCI